MKITRDMVTVLNKELSDMGCSFEFYYDEYGMTGNPYIKIKPISTKFIDSYTLNLTKDFYDYLADFFLERGIELSGNNDGSIMWSKNGWISIINRKKDKNVISIKPN